MKVLVLLACLCAGLAWSAAAADSKNDADSNTLVGHYEIVSGEKSGHSIPADRLHKATVRIAKNVITTYDRDKKEVYAASYTLDTSRKPWRIAMTTILTPVDGKGQKAAGLVQVDGENVDLIYALPGGKAPEAFRSGDQQQMFKLKRIAD